MKTFILLLFFSFALLQNRVAATDNCPIVPGCSRSKIEGLWKYAGTPFSYILYKAGNKASEAMGEIFVIIEYDIVWKNGCDHELVVTDVKTTKDTPEKFKPYLYKKGDVLKVKVNEVTDKLYRFTMIYQGKNRGCTEVFRAQ